MSRFVKPVGLLLCTILIMAADLARADNTQWLSTGVGAALGGVVGNQFGKGMGRVAATTTGIIVGGYVGNELGRSNEGSSSYYGARRTFYTEQPAIFYPTAYVPNYVAPPAPPPPQPSIYIDSQLGGYCRDYSQRIRSGNQIQESYGTVCLQPDGSWRVVN